ncbi:aminopeptidase [Oscillibacter sp. MSJ-2]|uniref:Aminopeptidase n=1 Tax=Dysosmobacter acutus TaxID=2841504 RepID=A0ABS6FE17_9FIRM|nr:aminopeptidase [Dysosmobacter acutus]MBU5627881.1 aminopeptidase [Dysosmobacter acutus]
MVSDMYFEFELEHAANVLINETCKLQKGETLMITCDTQGDIRLAIATAKAAFAAGGKPMVIWTASPLGAGKMVDGFLPSESILAAALKADAWVEFNKQYFLYSDTYQAAVDGNPKLRFLGLPGTTSDVFVKLYGRADQHAVAEMVTAVAARTKAAKHVRLTSALGQDVEFDNDPDNPVRAETGYWDKPGTMMLNGQVGWTPILDSVNGTFVFDGALIPQIGVLGAPVKVYIEKGIIQAVEGGAAGTRWFDFLKSFNHPQMLRPAHVCYGFHPMAELSGQNGEDERVWGCTEWGFGSVGAFLMPKCGGIAAPSHTDAVTLNTTVYLDGDMIMKDGKVIDPELAQIAAKCGK